MQERAPLREDTSKVPFYDSFIRPSSSAADKQTRASKLIKNGEVNSAPSEETEFSRMFGGSGEWGGRSFENIQLHP